MNETAKISWGFIGASTIASEWMIDAVNAQPNSEVLGLMSRSQERAEKLAVAKGIPNAYSDIEALLNQPDIDVIYISTTNERHLSEALQACAHAKHVLCEKPLALTMQDAIKMRDACKEAGVILGTNHHLRNAVTHRKIREIVAEGGIGKVLAGRVFHAVFLPEHLQGWRVKAADTGGGVILDITVHDADTLRFLLGSEVKKVTAMTASQGLAQGELADAVMGVMQFESGTQVQFHDAFTIKHAGTGLQLHGTEGSIIADNVMTQNPVGSIQLRRGDQIEWIDLPEAENLYVNSVRKFNEAVEGHGQPAATAEDGLRSLAVALAIQEAAQTGQHVKVSYPF